MKSSQEIVNESGYPLQIRLEQWIEETWNQHKWRVLAKEHRWTNIETKDDGYIDLILEKTSIDLRLVVECKRIIGNWNFLLPIVEPTEDINTRVLHINYKENKFLWTNIPLRPRSFGSSFCVLETEGKKDSRTLEKIAGELLLSLECLAVDETRMFRSFFEKLMTPPKGFMLYLPVIVTTSNLQAIIFNPSSIDEKNGSINESDTKSVQFIRFYKNLASNIRSERPEINDLKTLNQENNRTVLIVQAESFINFLSTIDTL